MTHSEDSGGEKGGRELPEEIKERPLDAEGGRQREEESVMEGPLGRLRRQETMRGCPSVWGACWWMLQTALQGRGRTAERRGRKVRVGGLREVYGARK